MLGSPTEKRAPSKYRNCILISEALYILFLIGFLYTVYVTGFSFNQPVTLGLVLTGVLSGYFVYKDRSELSEHNITVTNSSTVPTVALCYLSVTLYTLFYLYKRNNKLSEWHTTRDSSQAEIEAATTEIASVIDDARDRIETGEIDTVEEQLESIDRKISEHADTANNYHLDDLHDELLGIDAERRYLLNEIKRVRREQRRQRLQDDIDTITAELDEIEQLVDEGFVDNAQEKLDAIESDIEPIADAVDSAQSGVFRDVRNDLIRLQERRDGLLDKIDRKQQEQQYQRRLSQIDSIAAELDDIARLIDIDTADYAQPKPEEPEADTDPTIDGTGQDQPEESDPIRDGLTELRERREDLRDEINRKQKQRHQHRRNQADSTSADVNANEPPLKRRTIEEARRRVEELASDIESVEIPDTQPDSETTEDARGDVDRIEDRTKKPLSRVDEDQREQDRRNLEQRVAGIDSALDDIESSIEAGELDTAETRIEQVAPKLGSVETRVDAYESGVFEDIRADVTRLTDRGETLLDELRTKQRENQRQRLEDELDTLRSELDQIDALTESGSVEEAKRKLEKLGSTIKSAAKETRQHGFTDLREEVETLKQTRVRKLQEVTPSAESTTAPTAMSQALQVSMD